MYYSVPYEYVQNQVDIRVDKDLIEVYFKDMRIASHKILLGETGQYSTNPNHMPDNHRKYLEHTPAQIKKWSSSKGDNINDFIEKGCQTLMTISQAPSLSVLKSILKRMREKEKLQETGVLSDNFTSSDYGFVRGAKYFGGVKNEK